jgi:2-C-methyl-D-erythritol 4-phosphate cytidylyltransferase
MSTDIGAIIVGAGYSERMKGIDKLFAPLGDKPLLAWSLDICHDFKPINQIVIVLNENNIDLGKKLLAERNSSKNTSICTGGRRRQDSVWEGIKRLKRCRWVIIHDGARPFLTIELLADGLKSAEITGAAAAAMPVKDTIKLSDGNGIVEKTLPRNQLWAVQTPQIFRLDLITRAYEQAEGEFTDDASLVEKAGFRVKLYMGSYRNIKITTPEDYLLATNLVGEENESWHRL